MQRVLILGGGYAAYGVLQGLRPAVRSGEAEVTVVDRENFHFFHGLVAEMAVGRVAPTTALTPARRMFRRARFHMADVEHVDLEARRVLVEDRLDGSPATLTYDHLVVALGSVDNLELYPGLGEHAFRLKTFDDVFRLRSHIISVLEAADAEDDPAERERLLTFVIAGGGYSGTEVAGELAEMLNRLCAAEYSRISRRSCRVVLVQPTDHILPELYGTRGAPGSHPRLVDYATRELEGRGVDIRLGARITAATPNEVVLADGSVIPAHTIVSAVGSRPPPLLAELAVRKDPHGRLVTDPALHVDGYDDVWAAGDCAAVASRRGGTAPPRFLDASHQGRQIGRNIVRALRGGPAKPYRYVAFGQAVPLGGRRAVAEIKGVEMHGLLPWLVLRGMLLYYSQTWERRLHAATDWLLLPFVGYGIVDMRQQPRDHYDVRENLFQAGEEIIRQGRPGRFLHVVVDGEVEIVTEGSPEPVRVLGPGDAFGQSWVDAAATAHAIARTQVRTVAVRADQARRIRRIVQTVARAAGAPTNETTRTP